MGPSLTIEIDQLIIVAYDPHLTHHQLNMNTLVAQLQPQPAFRRETEEEDFTGYGNLDKNGMITGMALPRVADVSAARPRRLPSISHAERLCPGRDGAAADRSQHPSSLPTPTPFPPIPKAESSSLTERPRWRSSSRGVSSSRSIREQQQGVTSVRSCLISITQSADGQQVERSRRLSRSTRTCSARWREVLQTVNTGRSS